MHGKTSVDDWSFGSPPPQTDILVFAQQHSNVAQVLQALQAASVSSSDVSPVVFPAPLSVSIHTYSCCVTEVFPVPVLPKLSFRSVVLLHPASSSSPLLLDDARRHLASIVKEASDVPVLVLLEQREAAAASPHSSVDMDDLLHALDCERLSNPYHILPIRWDTPAAAAKDAAAAVQWLHRLLTPAACPLVWCSAVSLCPLLAVHLPDDLALLVLSYLRCQTRGAFLTRQQWERHCVQTAELAVLQARRQQRKELLRFLSSYSSHQSRHQCEDDAVFLPLFLSHPASFMFPNSSYAHLDLLRTLWVSMREAGLRQGSRLGWQRLQLVLQQDRVRLLLGHWARAIRRTGRGRDDRGRGVLEDEEREGRKRQERLSLRILHTTRWCCVTQRFVDLIVRSHRTHPEHHRSFVLSPLTRKEEKAAVTAACGDEQQQQQEVDSIPLCFPSFTSFLQSHPELLTLSFVEEAYSRQRLEQDSSWETLSTPDVRPINYWLPVLQEQMPSEAELPEQSIDATPAGAAS